MRCRRMSIVIAAIVSLASPVSVPRARSRLRARRAAPLAPNRFSADLLVRPMCTKGSSSYASSSFARARSAARSRPSDPSFALDDAAATARARARDAGARDANARTASHVVARAVGRAVVIARARCTAHARRAAACERAIAVGASRSGVWVRDFRSLRARRYKRSSSSA